MLNQAIAGAVPISAPMIKLVAHARVQIPKIIDAFNQGHSIARSAEIAGLMRLADTLASKKRSVRVSAELPAVKAVRKRDSELSEFNLKLERCMQRADEALRRSEMALQQARLTAETRDARQYVASEPHTASRTTGGFGWLALGGSALMGGAVTSGLFAAYVYLG
jgi:hypothetical protein